MAAVLLVFAGLYAKKYNVLLNADTKQYIDFVQNSPDEEKVKYFGKKDTNK